MIASSQGPEDLRCVEMGLTFDWQSGLTRDKDYKSCHFLRCHKRHTVTKGIRLHMSVRDWCDVSEWFSPYTISHN